jgi:hypothetical protein
VIDNDRQYAVTKEQARKLAEALASDQASDAAVDPRLVQAEREGLAGLLADMQREMAEYAARRGVRYARKQQQLERG